MKAELEETVRQEGEAAAFELGLHDLHPEVHRLMGRLHFRTSYGQNVLNHSQGGRLPRRPDGAGARASTGTPPSAPRSSTTSARPSTARCRARTSRSASTSSASTARATPVIQAVAAHHMDIDWPSLEAMLVQAADAISAARPGARRDILESYVKRLEKLEGIADSFKGVSKAFALQAGREIRILVESEKISDEEAVWLSKDIARRIESELEYPGQIKVTVIRETRAVEYAK